MPYIKKTHCKYGHEYTEANTITEIDKRGYTNRKCRECRKQYDRERYRDKPHYRERRLYIARCQYRGIKPEPNQCHAAPPQ